MCLAVFLLHKMYVIGGDDLHIVLLRQTKNDFVHLFLTLVNLGVAARLVSFMSLNLKIIILSKQALEPLDGLLCTFQVAVHDFLRHLARKAGRTTNHALVVLLQKAVVDARIVIKTIRVGDGTQFAKAVIALFVLGQ